VGALFVLLIFLEVLTMENKNSTQNTNEQLAMRVSLNTIIVNVILSAFKLFAGIFARSAAMVSDSVHSMSDVLSTVIVMVGVKMSNKHPDKEHPYGHERFECVAAVILAAVLFATGAGIGWAGLTKVLAGGGAEASTPGALALAAAVVSVAVKEAMYWYTRAAARRVSSGALMADAWHHRSDALSSVGSFAGILGARLGFPVLDPLACIIICVLIMKTAVDIFLDSIGKMTDKACDEKTERAMREVILAQESVFGIDLLKTRLFGDKIYVEVEISTEGENTLHEAHTTAQRVHDAIEEGFSKVKHCTVHVNPAGE
jgi:cation diffusion facilitator family transporter